MQQGIADKHDVRAEYRIHESRLACCLDRLPSDTLTLQ
jgi:hypothetical protein